jgi:putative phage-type endonuclease
VEQNSSRWLEWREFSLGSSDASIIMGESPYKTPYELWMEKTDRKAADQDKFAFTLGHKFEPYIRSRAESQLGMSFEPRSISSKDYPFMHASLDGMNMTGTDILEIKLNNKDVHAMVAHKGFISLMHEYQMQHQMLVAEVKTCWYASAPYVDDPEDLKPDDIVIIRVEAKVVMQEDLIKFEGAFVERLATDTPPALNERDGLQIRTGVWKRHAQEWVKLDKRIKDLKDKQKLHAKRLIEISDNVPVARGYGVVVKNTVRKGTPNYKAIPELSEVDLDQYRPKSRINSTVGGE